MYASNLAKNFATMNLSEVETSIVKATFEDDAPPKEKHILNLIELTRYEQDLSFSTSIFKRLIIKKWRIVLKTLILIHRLCRDGDEKCLHRLEARKSQLSPASQFTDKTSIAQTHLIRRYANYLDQKLRVYGLVSYSAERVTPTESKEWALKLSLDQAFVALPATQHQFSLLLSMDPMYAAKESRYIHPLAVIIFTMLLRDALRMYSVCTVELFVALENYEHMTREQTETFLLCCRKSHDINTAFRLWCQRLARCRIAKDCVPDFSPLPERFFHLLENRLDEFDGKPPRHDLGHIPASGSSSQTKSTAPAMAAPKAAKPPSQPAPANVKNIHDNPVKPTPAPAPVPQQPIVHTRQAGALTRLKAERRSLNVNSDSPGDILLPDPSLAANSRRLLSPEAQSTQQQPVRGRNARTRAPVQSVVAAPVDSASDHSSELELFEFDDEPVLDDSGDEDPFAAVAHSGSPQLQQQQQQQQQQQPIKPAPSMDPFNFDALDALLSNQESSNINVWGSPQQGQNQLQPYSGASSASASSVSSPAKVLPVHKPVVEDDPFAALAAEAEKSTVTAQPSNALVLHSTETRSANALFLYPAPLNQGFPDKLPVSSQFDTLAKDHYANQQRANQEFDPFAGLVKTAPNYNYNHNMQMQMQQQQMQQMQMQQMQMQMQQQQYYNNSMYANQQQPMYPQQQAYQQQQKQQQQTANNNFNPF